MDWIGVGWMDDNIIGQRSYKSTFGAKKNSRDTEKSQEAIFLPPGIGVPALLIRKLYREVSGQLREDSRRRGSLCRI